MANKTINGLTVTTSAASSDLVPIWVAGSGVTRKITKANFMGGILTGGGTIATGGNTLTVSGGSPSLTGGGTLALGGYTLTVPATGTAALYNSGSWTPTLSFGGAATGITYGARWGLYCKIADICFFEGGFTLSSKGSATGLPKVDGLPYTARNLSVAYVPCMVDWINMTTALVQMSATMLVNTTSFAIGGLAAAGITVAGLTEAAFSNNTELRFSGAYIV